MATVSLQEAAEQLRASKADVWRAIRGGSLSARRTEDGGFAIDSDELFRVFERPPPDQLHPQPAAAAAPAIAPETSARPEAAATNEATDEIADAFAALQAELKGLLKPVAAAAATEARLVEDEKSAGTEPLVAPLEPQPLHDEAAEGRANGTIDRSKADQPVPAAATKIDAQSPPKRAWWKRFAG